MAAQLEHERSREAQGQNWVTLQWDRFSLAIPRDQVQAVELSVDMAEALPHEMEAAWYSTATKPWPVYRFDDRMWPVKGLPQTGFVLFLAGQEPWGIWGEAVNVEKEDNTLRMVAMPSIFQRTASPAQALAVSPEGSPVLICSMQSIQRWIKALKARRAR